MENPVVKIDVNAALEELRSGHETFKYFFRHGSLTLELYSPDKVDQQQPHNRDEVYVIIAGSGTFRIGDKRMSFGPGDFLFVPAFQDHRFEEFTEDFATWVLFYGPEGGEK